MRDLIQIMTPLAILMLIVLSYPDKKRAAGMTWNIFIVYLIAVVVAVVAVVAAIIALMEQNIHNVVPIIVVFLLVLIDLYSKRHRSGGSLHESQ